MKISDFFHVSSNNCYNMWICIMRMVVGHAGNVHWQDWRLNIPLADKARKSKFYSLVSLVRDSFCPVPVHIVAHMDDGSKINLLEACLNRTYPADDRFIVSVPRIHRHVHRPLGNDHMWRRVGGLEKGQRTVLLLWSGRSLFALFVWPMTGMTESVPWGGVWPSVTCLIL